MSSGPLALRRELTIDRDVAPIAITEYPNAGQPEVVLLHGIGSRGQSWWPVIDPLAERFHLYQLDLRGHGDSGKPEDGYSVEGFAEDLSAVLDALNIEAPRIMGHSLGALVSLVWAREHPIRASALVLEDPPPRTEPEILDAFDGWQQLASLSPEAAAAWYHQEYPHWSDEDCLRRAETITSTAPGVFRDLRAASARALANGAADFTDLFASVQVPALVLRGSPELGGMLSMPDATRLAGIVPHMRVVTIPDAGHGLHRDAPEAFLAAVIPFLEQP